MTRHYCPALWPAPNYEAQCELPVNHSGPHAILTDDARRTCTWGFGADFTAKMSGDIQKPGARQDPQFVCALCGKHYFEHRAGEWREHFDRRRATGEGADAGRG